MKSFFKEVLITLVMAAIICVGFRVSLQTFGIFMTSMEPNFHEGQRLLVNKVAYVFGEPQRGDVVIFHAPGNGGDYIKRVIGLPGDSVQIRNRAVYVNGTRLDEPYIMDPPTYTLDKMTVPQDEYFVLGDNRNNSNDSHRGWTVPRADIIGKAWLSTWPPESWGIVPNYPLGQQLTASMVK
ncbi:MAG: signal peptidase I [Dehalococcoidales bacterium]|nr:signal peptidase I [Dehalococcoidales bacterium]